MRNVTLTLPLADGNKAIRTYNENNIKKVSMRNWKEETKDDPELEHLYILYTNTKFGEIVLPDFYYKLNACSYAPLCTEYTLEEFNEK